MNSLPETYSNNSLPTRQQFDNNQICEFQYKKTKLSEIPFNQKRRIRSLSSRETLKNRTSQITQTKFFDQNPKTSVVAHLFPLFGLKQKINLCGFPYQFCYRSNHSTCNLNRTGTTLFKINRNNVLNEYSLEILEKKGIIMINNKVICMNDQAPLNNGDSLKVLFTQTQHYSFIFITKEYLKSNEQRRLRENFKNSNGAKGKQSPGPIMKKYFGLLRLKRKVCEHILLSKFKITKKVMEKENKPFTLNSINYPINKGLKKFLKMSLGNYFQDLSNNKKKNENNLNRSSNQKRKIILSGPIESEYLIEKITKALANELNLQYFIFDFFQLITLLKIFNQQKTQKQQQQQQQQEQQQQQQQEQQQQQQQEEQTENGNQQNNEKKEGEVHFQKGDKILYVGPKFQNLNNLQIIKGLSPQNNGKRNWMHKKGNILLPKPGLIGEILLDFSEENSEFLGVRFDLNNKNNNKTDQRNNNNHNIPFGISNNDFFLQKSEIIKINNIDNQDFPAILCSELFKVLEKIKQPFLLFIPKIDQNIFHSYRVLENLKNGIEDLIANNENAFIISSKSNNPIFDDSLMFNSTQRLLKKKLDAMNLKYNSDSHNNNKIKELNEFFKEKTNESTLISNVSNRYKLNCEKQLLNFLSKNFGDTIIIRKTRSPNQIKKWDICYLKDQKINIIQHNFFILQLLCREINIITPINQKNNHLFSDKKYNPNQIKLILEYSLTNNLKRNFHQSETFNDINKKKLLNHQDLQYGINLFHQTNPIMNANNKLQKTRGIRVDQQDSDKIGNGIRRYQFESKREYEIYQQMLINKDQITTKFGDICGLGNIKEQIKEHIIYPIEKKELYNNYKLLKNKNNIRGLLIYGAPGNGKTMVSESIINEFSDENVTFLKLNPAIINSKYFGKSESNFEIVFHILKKCSPSILFIDQIDSMFSKTDLHDNENCTSRKLKNLFSRYWEDIQNNTGGNCDPNNSITIVGTTNRLFDLDEAIFSKFQKKIEIPFPNQNTRKLIFKNLLLNNSLVRKDFNFQKLSLLTNGYSSSDLNNLMLTTLNLPIFEQMNISNKINVEQINLNNETLSNSNFKKNRVFRKLTLSDFENSLSKIKKSTKFNYFDNQTFKNLYC
ncbi:putative aaa atpase [Anaeramoeba flamelloides]|uniref:Aaa atpase n=1 Tax=Anaeramoeba flamelloides TaxID=1746091 RepID=A0AAV7YWZ1_9EUKA|nr:putative aaa atpase [Anaeramoeba flamelloides]